MKTKHFIAFILATVVLSSNAQSPATPSITEKLTANAKKFPVEKLYLSFDRPNYIAGDTLWFKIFTLNSANKGTNISDRIYVELYNDSAKLVERKVIPLNNGLGNGDFSLGSKLGEGTYTIRAYSNWQQNFGSDYFFQKSFSIGNIHRTWRVTAQQTMEVVNGNRSLQLFARLTNLQNRPVGEHSVEISILKNGYKTNTKKYLSSPDGVIDAKISLSNGDKDAVLRIADGKIPDMYTLIPIGFKDNKVADLQFLPEGGYLVNNIFSKVAFKAIGADGLAREVRGKIINSKNEAVAVLASEHSGMGSFRLLPKEGETYTAVLGDGESQRFPLKATLTEGTVLNIDNTTKTDTMLVAIKAIGMVNQKDNFELVAQSGEKLVFGIKVNLKRGFFNLKLPTKDLPEGIVHFTLFGENQHPLNERSVFIPMRNTMAVGLQAKNSYEPFSPVSFDITAIDEQNQPLRGVFSVAVTDNSQVTTSDLGKNIMSHYLLESNLKGNIENASWYLTDNNLVTRTALDNLLLTQGWVGYNWSALNTSTDSIKFKPEAGNSVTGSVTNTFKKPLAGIRVTLMALGKTVFLTDTTTNEEGRFVFNNLPLLDSPAYIVKIKSAKGKSSGATIHVDQIIASEMPLVATILPPLKFQADSTLANLYRMSQKREDLATQAKIDRIGLNIKEVVVEGKNKSLPDSLSLDSKLFKQIDEKELFKTPQKDLFGLIDTATPQFNFVMGGYYFGQGPLYLVRADNIVIPQPEWTSFFYYLNAEDLKDLKIYRNANPESGSAYRYFIEITTRSGHGPWTNRAKGNYVFRPMPLATAKEFYSPKYSSLEPYSKPDLRTTIFWDANVVTDENGKATISFYAAGSPGSYSVKVEGADLLGRLGYTLGTLTISPPLTSK